jgi:hypothetical protein
VSAPGLNGCGTYAAYRRHQRHSEPACDACRAANNERNRKNRKNREPHAVGNQRAQTIDELAITPTEFARIRGYDQNTRTYR